MWGAIIWTAIVGIAYLWWKMKKRGLRNAVRFRKLKQLIDVAETIMKKADKLIDQIEDLSNYKKDKVYNFPLKKAEDIQTECKDLYKKVIEFKEKVISFQDLAVVDLAETRKEEEDLKKNIDTQLKDGVLSEEDKKDLKEKNALLFKEYEEGIQGILTEQISYKNMLDALNSIGNELKYIKSIGEDKSITGFDAIKNDPTMLSILKEEKCDEFEHKLNILKENLVTVKNIFRDFVRDGGTIKQAMAAAWQGRFTEEATKKMLKIKKRIGEKVDKTKRDIFTFVDNMEGNLDDLNTHMLKLSNIDKDLHELKDYYRSEDVTLNIKGLKEMFTPLSTDIKNASMLGEINLRDFDNKKLFIKNLDINLTKKSNNVFTALKKNKAVFDDKYMSFSILMRNSETMELLEKNEKLASDFKMFNTTITKLDKVRKEDITTNNEITNALKSLNGNFSKLFDLRNKEDNIDAKDIVTNANSLLDSVNHLQQEMDSFILTSKDLNKSHMTAIDLIGKGVTLLKEIKRKLSQ